MKCRLLVFSLLLTFTASAFEFTGKVVGVTDGDTIIVLAEGNKQHKVRLQHIDCPEFRQPFGSKAPPFISPPIFIGRVENKNRFRVLGYSSRFFIGKSRAGVALMPVAYISQAVILPVAKVRPSSLPALS